MLLQPVLLILLLLANPFRDQFLRAQIISNTTSSRPFRLITSGKTLTIQAKKPLKSLMVWTTDGHRVAEHRDINAPRISIELPVYRKTFFLMIAFSDGKIWTEKIAVK